MCCLRDNTLGSLVVMSTVVILTINVILALPWYPEIVAFRCQLFVSNKLILWDDIGFVTYEKTNLNKNENF